MAVCSFCGEDRTLTAEHVWSDAVLDVFRDVAPLTYDAVRGVAHGADSVIRDLCAECNAASTAFDGAAGAFAARYLRNPDVDGPFEFGSALAGWASKTACNQERVLATGLTWWTRYVDYFRDRAPGREGLTVLFARWPSSVNEALASQFWLAAHTIPPKVFRSGGELDVSDVLERGWALKVGFGVFLVLAWRTQATPDAVDRLTATLTSYGYVPATGSSVIPPSPYSPITAFRFSMLMDPIAAAEWST